MAISSCALMTLNGNFIIGIKTTQNFKMVDLVRIREYIDQGIYDQAYDINNDGILDMTDYYLLRDIVARNLFG